MVAMHCIKQDKMPMTIKAIFHGTKVTIYTSNDYRKSDKDKINTNKKSEKSSK